MYLNLYTPTPIVIGVGVNPFVKSYPQPLFINMWYYEKEIVSQSRIKI